MSRPPNLNNPRCIHCKIRDGTAYKGLCHKCYDDKDIRKIYPPNKKPVDPKYACVNCKIRKGKIRNLCNKCYEDRDIRKLYPKKTYTKGVEKYEDPTQEELDKMIAEQMANLPSWWAEASARQDRLTYFDEDE